MASHRVYYFLQIFTIAVLAYGAQIPQSTKFSSSSASSSKTTTVEPTVRIQCLSGSMLITIKDAPPSHENGLFSGMIYPKGLSKNSTCLTEYRDHDGPLRYKLPLRSCNTMPQETDDGGIEFFNTIVLQPHLKLVTDLGRGYHVRCRYQSREAATKQQQQSATNWAEHAQPYRSDANDPIESSDRRDHGRSLDIETKLTTSHGNGVDADGDVPMPGCHMKIYTGDKIAENVKIGDPLTLVVNIDEQELYGLHVTDCLVRDGLGWGEQKLINDNGCPLDNEIMGSFEYSEDRMAATVTFPAHKFPYTASVYYQCNVRLCALQDPDCQKAPTCGSNKRPKRQANGKEDDSDGLPAFIEVYSGLYVNENPEISESDGDSVFKEKTPDDALCISQRTFAIAIAIAGLILMLAVVAAVLCIMARRRGKTVSNSGSSIYSGPYTNTAFSHSS
ncbi:uncharacterized protein LOC119650908 [Hermetia illucens]|nr:uncharacterized protein LOC119650908 [Hermetia illucens]XP_037910067.1 uncharacterized protein LOC119650908 [Hermetia illucens]XP_037910073.1 uncharacterized protein LOC119650908 [Hermetia illucens]